LHKHVGRNVIPSTKTDAKTMKRDSGEIAPSVMFEHGVVICVSIHTGRIDNPSYIEDMMF